MVNSGDNQTNRQSDNGRAKRLAQLLAQSVMPEEQKAAWIHLLPLMSMEQVSQLMQVLEQEIASYQAVSKSLITDLENLAKEMKQSLSQLKQKERQEIEQHIQALIHGR